MEAKYKEQVATLQAQVQKITAQRRALQEEVARLREDEARLKSEGEVIRTELATSIAKHDKEVRLRVDAEVRHLDKTRWAEKLQAELEKTQRELAILGQQLKQEVTAKELAQAALNAWAGAGSLRWLHACGRTLVRVWSSHVYMRTQSHLWLPSVAQQVALAGDTAPRVAAVRA